MNKQSEETPSKIYVQVNDGKTITLNKVFDNDICYISKDALLEWLQQGFDWIKNPVISVQQIIDKLNSM